MQIQVSGHQFEVTSALRDYAVSKFDRITRHFDHLIDVHVVLSTEKLRHKAEATVSASQKIIHAFADNEDMYAAIDELSDKLDRQVKKHKEKLTDHKRGVAPKQREVG